MKNERERKLTADPYVRLALAVYPYSVKSRERELAKAIIDKDGGSIMAGLSKESVVKIYNGADWAVQEIIESTFECVENWCKREKKIQTYIEALRKG